MKRLMFFFSLFIYAILVHAQSDAQWPVSTTSGGNTITVYQPQPDTFANNRLSARAAISVLQAGQKSPVFGVIWMNCTVSTDRDQRVVYFDKTTITNIKFPDQIDDKTAQTLTTLVQNTVPSMDMKIDQDKLLASLDANQQQLSINKNFKNEAPEMIFVKDPSVLVMIDGDPRFQTIQDSKVQQVVNTPFFIVTDNHKKYYLAGGDMWYEASDVKGEWTSVKNAPHPIKELYETYKKQSDGSSDSTFIKESQTVTPKIYVRTTPAELIESSGELNLQPIQGTQLLYGSNTENDIFMDIASQKYFILLSGRWFSSSALSSTGWVYVSADKLPADFSKIAAGSEKDNILPFVAGTPEAKDAILDASIPQTAEVDRSKATCTVTYDGDPKFENINGTNLYYGVNTSSSVLLYNKTYYVCENAVWFQGNTPTGPWIVADNIPDEIHNIPSSSPVYNVKYVYIYSSTPQYVYVGYTPGYTGCYVYGPTIVYGTGYYYNPWYNSYYYPRMYTYGFNYRYNPYYGWSLGFAMSSGGAYRWCGGYGYGGYGYGGYGYGGAYAYGGMGYGGWWGPSRYRAPMYIPYNHYYGPYRPMIVNHNSNIYMNNHMVNNYNNRPGGNYNRGGGNYNNFGNRGGYNYNHVQSNNIYNNHNSGAVRPGGQGHGGNYGNNNGQGGHNQNGGNHNQGGGNMNHNQGGNNQAGNQHQTGGYSHNQGGNSNGQGGNHNQGGVNNQGGNRNQNGSNNQGGNNQGQGGNHQTGGYSHNQGNANGQNGGGQQQHSNGGNSGTGATNPQNGGAHNQGRGANSGGQNGGGYNYQRGAGGYNNVTPGNNGNVYRNNNGNIQQYNGQRFQNQQGNNNANAGRMQQQFQNMNRGNQQSNNAGGYQYHPGGGNMGGGGYHPSGGGNMGGGGGYHPSGGGNMGGGHMGGGGMGGGGGHMGGGGHR